MSFDMTATFQAMEATVKSGAAVEEGMRSLLALCASHVWSPVWRELEDLAYGRDVASISDWLAHVLTHQPPTDRIVAYWFGLFTSAAEDGGERCTLYVAGAERFDADDPDWACDPAYFPARRYATSEVLHRMHRAVHLGGGEVSEIGGYVLPLGYACLAIAQACQTASITLLLGNLRQRQVAVGYDEGDYVHLGIVDRTGWHFVAPAVSVEDLPADQWLASTMAAYAQDAVDMARKRFRIGLDLSEDSLAQVESILDQLYRWRPKGLARLFRRDPSDEEVQHMAKLWGAYLGEVVRRRWGGQWTLESALYAEPTVTLRLPWDEEIYPSSKVYKRLTNGPEDNVWLFYRVLRQDWSAHGAPD